ncbi:hypothetical protein ABWC92_004602 [Escherichia coli]
MNNSNNATEREPDTQFFGLPPLLNDDAILDKAKALVVLFAPLFPATKADIQVTDTRNARMSVKKMVAYGINEQQYPGYATTESYKQLVALVAALNLLAPKWKLQIKPYQTERDLTLGFYDYLYEADHPSRIAGDKLKTYFSNFGQFNESAELILSRTENFLVEMDRLWPLVTKDLFSPYFDHKTGKAEIRERLDNVIDNLLLSYAETTHCAQDENTTLALHRHMSKNLVLNGFINSGHYHQWESVQLTSIISAFNQWAETEVPFEISTADENDWRIAYSFAAIHAVDRPSGFDWRAQIQRNLQQKYIQRMLQYVRYVRYAKTEKGKSLSLRLISRGSTNKDLVLYPALLRISEKIYDPDAQVMCENADETLAEMSTNAELIKFMGNIFGVLSCFEGDEADLNVQMMSYCENRKNHWEFRTNFMCKLLRLDYDQMKSFLQEMDEILSPDCAILQSMLDQKLELYQRN